MKTFTPEQVNTAFDHLPEDVSLSITRTRVNEQLEKITKKDGLSIDKAGLLSSYVTFVLIGLARPEDFLDMLVEGIGLEKNRAQEVLKDANELIFGTVRDNLRSIRELEKETAEEAEGTEEGEAPSNLPIEGLEKKESDVLEASEIIVDEEKPVIEPVISTGALEANREYLLRGVENPPPSPSISIAQKKLGGTFSLPKQETEHTPAPITREKDKPATSKIDPYREPV